MLHGKDQVVWRERDDSVEYSYDFIIMSHIHIIHGKLFEDVKFSRIDIEGMFKSLNRFISKTLSSIDISEKQERVGIVRQFFSIRDYFLSCIFIIKIYKEIVSRG